MVLRCERFVSAGLANGVILKSRSDEALMRVGYDSTTASTISDHIGALFQLVRFYAREDDGVAKKSTKSSPYPKSGALIAFLRESFIT